MFLRRSAVVAAQELRLVVRDPLPLLIGIALPVALIGFIEPAVGTVLRLRGTGEIGAVHAVPGMAVMFILMGTEVLGLGFYREHAWNTWERLRASPLSPREILAGKATVYLATGLFQLTAIFAAGVLVFGLRLDAAELAGCLVLVVVLAITAVCLAFVVTALTNTTQQLNAASNLAGLVVAALGGALVPVYVLPTWAQQIAPATPSYWAMRGFRIALQDGGGLVDVLPSAGMLLVFAVAAAVIAARLFTFADQKMVVGGD